MKEVAVLSPAEYNYTFVAGPAQFGPHFGINNFVSIDWISVVNFFNWKSMTDYVCV